MRRLSTLFIILFACLYGTLSAQSTNTEEQSIVMKVDEFSAEVNMSIYNAFQHDDKLAIINSCDILGLVVFAPKVGEARSKAQSKSYVSVKMNELRSEVPGSYRFIDDLSAGEVLMQCRQKMQENFKEVE